MKTHVPETAEFGELVLAAFDGAAHYSTDPLVVARLAAAAPPQRTTGAKAADPSQWA